MENITASEVAGLGVGTLLLCATIAAPKVDAFISASQRSSLGICKKCGDVKMIACSRCRGIGYISTDGPLSFPFLDDLSQWFAGDETRIRRIPCTNCRARGSFTCPDCSKPTKT